VTEDPYEQYDAAYVLGALTSDDRRAYERHLETCQRCADAVRELAGMPGLLANVDPGGAHEAPVPPVPETLLPRVLTMRRRERRRRWLVGGIAGGIAAAAAVVAAVLVGIGVLADDEVPHEGEPSELAFEQVVESPVHANGDLNEATWGTRVDIDCTYDTGTGYDVRSYKLIVESEDGRREQIAVWKVRPGQDVSLTGSTDLSPSEIALIDIATTDGTSLLRARP